jgi:hypothetical protein
MKGKARQHHRITLSEQQDFMGRARGAVETAARTLAIGTRKSLSIR